ncbi:MAG: hypothetical protein ACHQCE_22370 [Streptosporangiales bacterium]
MAPHRWRAPFLRNRAGQTASLMSVPEAGRAVASQVLTAIADLERDALSRLPATQIAGYHAVIAALQEAC